jgi:hypothetical protein
MAHTPTNILIHSLFSTEVCSRRSCIVIDLSVVVALSAAEPQVATRRIERSLDKVDSVLPQKPWGQSGVAT